MGTSAEIAVLSEHFVDGPATFTTSPLYQTLCTAVADDPATLELLTARRTGQQASFLLFAAVQDLLLRGVRHPLRDFYPSVVGDAMRDPVGAGPVFLDFCRRHREELEPLIRTRLVQTNVLRRVVGLRYALWAIGQRSAQPVHLIEVGASAGMHLFVDRYRYLLGGQVFGSPDARVAVDSLWRSTEPLPDLDAVPAIASRIGVDLNPIDITDPQDRLWMRALVWPEDLTEASLLDTALAELVKDPPTIIAGDAIDVCPRLGRDLPAGETRVVFHAATRMHVPTDRHVAFDNAIDSIGDEGPLYHVWLEPPTAPHHPYAADERAVIAFHGPGDDEPTSLIRVDGHLHWFEPLT